jgi:hypothetical protein
MPKGEQRGNREAKKPKKDKAKTNCCRSVDERDSGSKRRSQEVGQPPTSAGTAFRLAQ